MQGGRLVQNRLVSGVSKISEGRRSCARPAALGCFRGRLQVIGERVERRVARQGSWSAGSGVVKALAGSSGSVA